MLADLPKVVIASGRVRTLHLADSEIQALSSYPTAREEGQTRGNQ